MRWLDWGTRIPMEYFALIRIALGLNFAGQALTKLGQGYLSSGEPMTRYIQGQLRSPFVDAPYRAFLESVVVPNAAIFATCITLAELVIGICLILGLGTRAAAAVGLFLGINYWLTGGVMGVSASLRSFMVIELVVLLAVPGVVWGLDRLLLGRAPWWLVGRPVRLPIEQMHAARRIVWVRLSGFASEFSYLGLLRIIFGFTWLVAGTNKLVWEAVLTDPARVVGQIERYGRENPRDPLSQLWMDTVVSNYPIFGPLVVAGELTAGLLLFLGLFTRAGALVGMWMSINYMMMKGWVVNEAFNDRTWFICQLVFFITGAGLVAGLDGAFKRWLPRWLTGAEATETSPRPTPAPNTEPLPGTYGGVRTS